MGTRADFYIEKNENIEWKGSIAFDGYSIYEADENDLSPNDKLKRTQIFLEFEIKNSKDETHFCNLLDEYLKNRDDASLPFDGWPWPWNNSKLTDETYLFKNGKVWRMFAYDGKIDDHTTPCKFAPIDSLFYTDEGEEIEQTEMIILNVPDMKRLKNVQKGKKSGLLVVGL